MAPRTLTRWWCLLAATIPSGRAVPAAGGWERARVEEYAFPGAPPAVPRRGRRDAPPPVPARRLASNDIDLDLHDVTVNDGDNVSNVNVDDSDTCVASGASCAAPSAACCQGGCTATRRCYCQAVGGPCVRRGGRDPFCCSNRCGRDGRCRCIQRGKRCDVGGGHCCPGLACGGDKRCNKEAEASGGPTTPGPTPGPTPAAAACQPNNRVCFKQGRRDEFCCSRRCGANGRCLNVWHGAPGGGTPTRRPTAGRPTHGPTATPTAPPTATPSAAAPSSVALETRGDPPRAPEHGCAADEVLMAVEIETDKYGADVAWSVAPADAAGAPLAGVRNGTYGAFAQDRAELCVAPGRYAFAITDVYGDGICCAYGDGYVQIRLGDREVLHVQSYGAGMAEILHVGYDPAPGMTARDVLYLEAHNRRRKLWFEGNEVDHVPLAWSPRLAEEARAWAETLLVNCSGAGIEHEAGVREGENLAKNTGSVNARGGGWGQLYPPDSIVRRWVDHEVDRPYPGNAHLTQALWRPARYLGCGESAADFRGGRCRVQVCRYARAGNCDMGRWNATEGRNWLAPMLADASRCGPHCAPEGCF